MEYRHGYADVSFGQMHYTRRTHQAAPAGSVLVLLNPRARSSLPMLSLFPQVRDVVGIDLPGFGRSSPLPGKPAMRDIASGMMECLDALGIARTDLFGLHTGHKIAAAMALHWPERIRRLVIAGRSHSLIPEHAQRNAAMRAVVEENQVDMAIIRMEGRHADEGDTPRVFAAVFDANFAFDFAAAMRAIAAPTLVLEFASEREDRLYGRQAHRLIEGMRQARVVVMPQTDVTGLSLYIGTEALADAIRGFCGSDG